MLIIVIITLFARNRNHPLRSRLMHDLPDHRARMQLLSAYLRRFAANDNDLSDSDRADTHDAPVTCQSFRGELTSVLIPNPPDEASTL